MLLKIIYLDDEPALCELFVDNFASEGVSIQTFTNPENAVAAINQSIPDLIFLDYRLPQTTGEVVALRLNSAIPKALITGDLNVKAAKTFVKVFYKPFDFAEMEAFIQSYVDQKRLSIA